MEENKPSSFKLRSGNRTAFKQMGSSDVKPSPMTSHIGSHGYHKSNPHGADGPAYNSRVSRKRYNRANLDDNPAIHRNTMFQGDYLGEGGWQQEGWGKHNYKNHPEYLKRFDLNNDGKLSKKENRKAKKSKQWQTWQGFHSDVKRDLTVPLLTQDQANKGQYLVQDPYGKWHRMSHKGTPLGGRGSYDKRSWEWRQGNVWDPNAGPGGKGGYVPYTGQGFDHDVDATQTAVINRHHDQGGGLPEGGKLNEFEPLQEPIHLEKRTIDKIPTEPLPGPIMQNEPVTPQEGGGDDVTTEETSDDTQEYASRDEAFAAARERGDKQFGYDTDGDGEIGPNEYYHTRLDTETKDEWNAKFGGGDTPSPGPEPGDDTIAHSEGVAGPKSAEQVDMEPSVGGGDDPLTQEIMDTSDLSSDDGGGDSDPIVIEKDEKDDSPNKRRGFRFKRKY